MSEALKVGATVSIARLGGATTWEWKNTAHRRFRSRWLRRIYQIDAISSPVSPYIQPHAAD